MGKVIDILRRPRPVGQTADEFLERASQFYREELEAAHSLPGALAALARAGHGEKTLSLLVAWGERASSPRSVLQQVRQVLEADR